MMACLIVGRLGCGGGSEPSPLACSQTQRALKVAGELLDRRVSRQVREVVLTLAGQMLGAHIVDTLRRSVGGWHAHCCRASRELDLGATSPAELAPFYQLQRGLCRIPR